MTQLARRHQQEDPLLLELSTEVCRQVGGIYTVLRTKVPAMQERWGANYLLIGVGSPTIEFEECAAPDGIRDALLRVEERGIRTSYGKWLVQGRPNVILLDLDPWRGKTGELQYLFWKDNGISTPAHDHECQDAILLGFAVEALLEELLRALPRKRLLLHAHEWLAGVVLPRIKHRQLPVATVFTTHATLLGRHLAGARPDFYASLESIDPESAARQYGIHPRYVIERVAAQTATVFTTISEITAREARHFLGRVPEAILPNGLNVERFAALHEFQNLHLKYKERIHEFVMGHFFPSYSFDIDRTLYLFTSGRYEYRNKGFDVFIEALYRLNRFLKGMTNPPTVVAFLVTRAWTKNINVNALQRHLMFEELRALAQEVAASSEQVIVERVARGEFPTHDELIPPDARLRMKRILHARKSERLPAIVTHDMGDDANDAILQHLRHRHLFNEPGDPVKVVFHPDFLSQTNPLFGLDYDQFVRGCHLGVFPSAYEPWGYTPPECLALGIPAVTTDLSGFGAYVSRSIPRIREQGVYVLSRAGKSTDDAIEELATYLYSFCQLHRRDRIELRNRAERLSDLFDWSHLARHYHGAHEEALRRLSSEA